MPTLAMLADNGGIVTVNPDWCDWYEQVFNEPAGAGYVKGREIMNQVDQSYSELLSIRSEAMKSAIHSMISNDPNRPTVRFKSIAEAEKSFKLSGKHAMDFDKEEQVFTFDGYFSVSDMEAILFIRRAEELIDKAKERFPGFSDCATGSYKELDINQLMQVMQPSLSRTDIDSEIFATPVAESPNRAYMFPDAKAKASPMAEQFNSVVEAHATLAESGILRQNVIRTPGVNNLVLDGYFTPKDLEALLYLYRNNDPMVFPEKDANGLPKDSPAGDKLNRKTFMELLGVTPETSSDEVAEKLRAARLVLEANLTGPVAGQYLDGLGKLYDDALEHPSSAKALLRPTGDDFEKKLHAEIVGGSLREIPDELPTGNAVLNRLITEGGGLRRGEWAGEAAARTDINRTSIVGGTRIHCFEEGDDDFPMMTALIKKIETFEEQFGGLSLADFRAQVDAPWAEGGVAYFKKEDGHFSLVFEKNEVVVSLFSFKVAEHSNPPGQIVLCEHAPSLVNYTTISSFFDLFISITPEQVKEAKDRAIEKHGQ
jgi:hypothetical protein